MNIDNLSLKKVMNTMAEGVLVLDSDGNIILWNKAMEIMTGWSAEEMIGAPCSDLVCSLHATPSQNALDQSTATAPNVLRYAGGKSSLHQVECALNAKNGDMIPVFKNARVIDDEGPTPSGMVITLTDLRPIRQLQAQLAASTLSAADRGETVGRLVGGSANMHEVYKRIKLAAEADVTVLIEGETGTGKELVAEAIHQLSARSDKPLIKVNCSALSESILESELFGHVKGAFTGAIKDKAGRIESAEGGTLFLDEIGDISPLIQLKLLRVLQEHEYERVGESVPRRANVRFIAATHRNLKQRVQEGEFREDFYYRVRVFSVGVPPLREHREDIPTLCEAFMQKLNKTTGKTIRRLGHDTLHCLMDYCWPGNIRELENAIEHAYVTCQDDTIEHDDLPLEIRSPEYRRSECMHRDTAIQPHLPQAPAQRLYRRKVRREEVIAALHQFGGNRSAAAQHLGIDRSTLWRKIKQWNLDASL